MRIAQIAPLYESVPPKMYGGTERVVYYLTEELVRQGHEVTLFASGDSETSARLVAPRAQALRLDESCRDQIAHHVHLVEQVCKDTSRFDVMHFHIEYLHYSLATRQSTPHVTTFHGRQDLPDLIPIYREFADIPVVSISNDQRRPVPWLNWQATVYHGLPENLYTLQPQAGDYLAFLGRFSQEKRPDRAIRIAQRFGMKLKMAAKMEKAFEGYFSQQVEPLMDDSIEILGEIGEAAKNDFLGNAYALLFSIDWPEPFGLVMIEAMACGTPVVAWRSGAVPEVIEDGVTGFIVESEEEAVAALRRCARLDRARIREEFVRRFSISRCVRDYVNVFERLVSRYATRAA